MPDKVKNAKPVTWTLSVSGQDLPQDLTACSAAGFKAVICNRPDGEAADQPPFAEIEVAATALRAQAACLPVCLSACLPIMSGKVGDPDMLAFGTAIVSLPKPILAVCRTGTWWAKLWFLPSFPGWLIDGTGPSHLAWLPKERVLPTINRKAMPRRCKWLAKP